MLEACYVVIILVFLYFLAVVSRCFYGVLGIYVMNVGDFLRTVR